MLQHFSESQKGEKNTSTELSVTSFGNSLAIIDPPQKLINYNQSEGYGIASRR
jgi:hypothetical protein